MANPNIQKVLVLVVMVIVAIILIFNLVAESAPDLKSAADNISGSRNISGTVRSLPLAGLFQSDGVVMLLFMAGILLVTIFVTLKLKSKK